MSYPLCAQTGRPPCINDAGEIVDPARGPWWAHPMVTKFTVLPASPARVQPVVGRFAARRPLRGFGAVDTGSCPDAFGDDPCAALLAQLSPSAASAAAGLPTSWLTTSLTSLGGIPGWALLALGGGLLLFVFAASGGRRR